MGLFYFKQIPEGVLQHCCHLVAEHFESLIMQQCQRFLTVFDEKCPLPAESSVAFGETCLVTMTSGVRHGFIADHSDKLAIISRHSL